MPRCRLLGSHMELPHPANASSGPAHRNVYRSSGESETLAGTAKKRLRKSVGRSLLAHAKRRRRKVRYKPLRRRLSEPKTPSRKCGRPSRLAKKPRSLVLSHAQSKLLIQRFGLKVELPVVERKFVSEPELAGLLVCKPCAILCL